jgi:hypothetical protein
VIRRWWAAGRAAGKDGAQRFACDDGGSRRPAASAALPVATMAVVIPAAEAAGTRGRTPRAGRACVLLAELGQQDAAVGGAGGHLPVGGEYGDRDR